MAQQGVLLDQDQFCCSVCLDLLKEPVTIPCGHSYCRSCIEGCWDQDVLKGVYSCPQCRETFIPRPNLRKNNMLAEVVEKLRKTGLQAAPPPALCYAGPGDVVCDVCTGTRKQKALMSCLACLASYCETHLQPHYESPAFKKHKLVKATAQLQEKICSHHDKLLEVYCRTDQQCICYLCTMDEHKGHDTVSAAAERTEKQRQLGMSQQKVQQRFQEREKELKELQQAVESFKTEEREQRLNLNFQCPAPSTPLRQPPGGGVCLMANVTWCDERNIQELKSFCSPDLEFLTIKCRPHYLPREFSSIIITAVYIPQADTSMALNELYLTLCKLETIYPEAAFIVAGDFNKANLKTRLPKFYQHIDCATRGGKTLDHCYSNFRDAYKALPRPLSE
uniref:Fish virus induced TRIM protein n=1 Tax=Oncorhynchus tshawytscha TaxID=74940 RepID=A0AAZ3Q1D7_ONCTS